MTTRNPAASVRARLLNKARADGVDFQLLLTRCGLERLLYRPSASRERDNFLLKGALLFDLWYDVPLRPTRDIDLLGFGLAEIPLLVAAFEDICAIEVDDGMAFDAVSMRADEIRKEANYAGIRLTLTGTIDGARCPVQSDVGYAKSPRYKKASRGTDWPERAIFERSTEAHAMGCRHQSQSTDGRLSGKDCARSAHSLVVSLSKNTWLRHHAIGGI